MPMLRAPIINLEFCDGDYVQSVTRRAGELAVLMRDYINQTETSFAGKSTEEYIRQQLAHYDNQSMKETMHRVFGGLQTGAFAIAFKMTCCFALRHRFDFRNFPVPVYLVPQVRYKDLPNEGEVLLLAAIATNHRDTGKPIIVQMTENADTIFHGDDGTFSHAARNVLELIRTMIDHEVMECAKFDGKLIVDDHE